MPGLIFSPLIFMGAAFFFYGQLHLIKERELFAAIFLSPVLSAPLISVSIGVFATATGRMSPGSFEIVVGAALLAGMATASVLIFRETLDDEAS